MLARDKPLDDLLGLSALVGTEQRLKIEGAF